MLHNSSMEREVSNVREATSQAPRSMQEVLQTWSSSSLQSRRGHWWRRLQCNHREIPAAAGNAAWGRQKHPGQELQLNESSPEQSRRPGRDAAANGDLCRTMPQGWALWYRAILEKCSGSCSLWEAHAVSIWKGLHPWEGPISSRKW